MQSELGQGPATGAEVSGALVLVGAVLVLASLALAPLAIALARWIVPGRNVFFARWRFAHLGLVLGAFAVLFVIAGIAWSVFGGEEQPGALVQVGAMVAIEVLISALIFAIAQRMDPNGWRSLGLWRGGHARAALCAVAAYVLALPGLVGIVPLWQALLDSIGVGYHPQEIAELALGLRGPALVAFLVCAVAVVPFFEELFFRGFLQPLLVQNLGDRGGVLVTSLIFAALHGLSAGVPILALSLLLGALMLRTQRLTASWLVHALHNGSMLALLFLVPDSSRLLGQ